jgi:hypothetical protein
MGGKEVTQRKCLSAQSLLLFFSAVNKKGEGISE